MAWVYKMIQQSFLPILFSKIAQTYNKSDVFTTEELKDIIALYVDVVNGNGGIVCDWRNTMTKY